MAETSATRELRFGAWWRVLQLRCETLSADDRADALIALAPRLHHDRELEAAVAMLTVVGLFPRSWPLRVATARTVLREGNRIDELATALLWWVRRRYGGAWIARALSDPTAVQRHAARGIKRGVSLCVGSDDAWKLAGIGEIIAGVAQARTSPEREAVE